MLKLSIPGYKNNITLKHLVLDFNGTLAVDGKRIKGLKKVLTAISKKIQIHVLTGDTHGTAKQELKDLPVKVKLLGKEHQAAQKQKYVHTLDPATVISIGNGRNDKLLLQASAIGIIVVQGEGAAAETLVAADVVCPDILTALELINNPLRLTATLRS